MSEFQDWLNKLKTSAKPVIVEGKKDEKALLKLGVTNKIFKLSKEPVFRITERVAQAGSEAIILTDFDKKGKELYGKLNTGLQSQRVTVDNYFREWLQKNTKLSHIEGIDKLAGHLE
ncbi:MAG: hypothetical protein ACOCQX_04780 [Candidatus Nanoarchaeia archaeon]